MSVSIPDPLTSPEAWDHIIVESVESPGLALVAGAGDPRKWDKQDGQGQSGATLKYGGDGLAQFTVTLSFWLAEHFTAWSDFKRLLKPPKGERPKALDIYHPALEDVGVSSVVVEDVGQLRPDGDDGKWSVAIKFLQYRPPEPARAVPQGSGGGGGGRKVPGGSDDPAPADARDEYDDMIDSLRRQLEEEANK